MTNAISSGRNAAACASVLFVDDEPQVLEALAMALRRERFEILARTSAQAGLELLEQRGVDVVVSDEKMPVMGGAEFLARVREKFPDTVRIILSGEASRDALVRAINESEIYRFLAKPCPPALLAQTIRDGLLIRELKRESLKLLAAARERRSVIEDLERRHPGLTRVERDSDGAIVLDDLDPAALLGEMAAESARARRGPPAT